MIDTSAPVAFRSQAGQDLFALAALRGKRHGLFVDIGAGHPEHISNTVMLERDYGWSGILCDIATEAELRAVRSPDNTVYGDAFEVNWLKAISGLPLQAQRVDYLSLDLEPPLLTLCALCLVPLDAVRFSVITIEHDSYRGAECAVMAEAMRAILLNRGYLLVARDVQVLAPNGKLRAFEDWWLDGDFFTAAEIATATQAADQIRAVFLAEWTKATAAAS